MAAVSLGLTRGKGTFVCDLAGFPERGDNGAAKWIIAERNISSDQKAGYIVFDKLFDFLRSKGGG